MSSYTVILHRPECLGDECRVVVEHVTVGGVMTTEERQEEAVRLGQKKAYEADQESEHCDDNEPDGYLLLVLFPGHIQPLLFGD